MRKSLRCGGNPPPRSLDDPEDETFYDVECLTPDELADESMTSLSRIRRITYVSSMSVPDLLYPDRK